MAASVPPGRPADGPLGYLITFACYGQRLHGDLRGSVDRFHNQPGSLLVPEDPRRVAYLRTTMVQEPYRFDKARRRIVLQSLIATCEHSGWVLAAAHVRTTHLHALVAGVEGPARVMKAFKMGAAMALRRQLGEAEGTRRFAKGGSKRQLWTADALESAIGYVVERQGEPLSVYAPDLGRPGIE